MTDEPFTCCAAGVRISTNRPVLMQSDPIDADCTCTVQYDEAASLPPHWHALPENEFPACAYLKTDGTAAIITRPAQAPDERATQIRMLAPFAAALQGKLTLHASCVRREGRAYGFIGGSGVGKSTFARYLLERGWQLVCDDLLPCREAGGRFIIRSQFGAINLQGLFFLQRTYAEGELHTIPLRPAEAMVAHLQNGFGEMHHRAAWALQFKAYGELSRKLSNYRLLVPDNISRLAQAAQTWCDQQKAAISL